MNPMLNEMFKSIVDHDRTSVVICDTSHTIVYMNPAAVANYGKRGGSSLIGKSIFDCHNPVSVEMIKKVVNWFEQSTNNNIIHTFYNEKQNKDVYMVALRDEAGRLLGYYEKHEFRDRDTSPFYDLGQEKA